MELKQCERCHTMKNISEDSVICKRCEDEIKKIPLEEKENEKN